MNPMIGNSENKHAGFTDEQINEVNRINQTYSFTEVLDLDFNSMTKFTPSGATGSNSIGQFNNKDILRVFKFDDAACNAIHQVNAPYINGYRHDAFYDKDLAKVLTIESQDGIKHLVQGGSRDENYGVTPLATSWIDTYGITFTDRNNGIKGRDVNQPGVTFRKNTYYEIEVNFGEQRTPGFRHSWWLMPATLDDENSEAVDFDDRRPFIGSNVYNMGRPDSVNGLEIDIYEHVYTSPAKETLLMKGISGDITYDSSGNPVYDNYGNPVTESGIGNTINTYSHTLTREGENKAHPEVPGIADGANFHRIGFMWHESEMIWLVDGKPLVRDDKLMPNNVRMYMLLTREANHELYGGQPELPENESLFASDKVKIRSIKIWSISSTNGGNETATTKPPAPFSVSATSPTGAYVDVSWSAVPQAEKYNVYKKIGSGSSLYLTTVAGTTTCRHNGVSAGTTYAYTVVSIDESQTGDNRYSRRSTETTITVGGGETFTDKLLALFSTAKPPAPSSVSATSPTGAYVDVSWSTVSKAEKYNVYKKIGSGSSLYLTTITGTTTFRDNDVSASTTYAYTLVSIDEGLIGGNRYSKKSTETTITVGSGETVTAKPPAPSSVLATSPTGTYVNVSWSAVPQAEKYNVYKKIGSGSSLYLTTVTGTTTFRDNGVSAGTAYAYTVVSIDEDKTGDNRYSRKSTETTITV